MSFFAAATTLSETIAPNSSLNVSCVAASVCSHRSCGSTRTVEAARSTSRFWLPARSEPHFDSLSENLSPRTRAAGDEAFVLDPQPPHRVHINDLLVVVGDCVVVGFDLVDGRFGCRFTNQFVTSVTIPPLVAAKRGAVPRRLGQLTLVTSSSGSSKPRCCNRVRSV